MLLHGNTVVRAAVALDWCIICCYLPNKMYCFHCVEEFLCPSTKFSLQPFQTEPQHTNLNDQRGSGKTDLLATYVGWLVGCSISICDRLVVLLQQYLI